MRWVWLALLFAFAQPTKPAHACSCTFSGPQYNLQQAAVVFRGTVTHIQNDGEHRLRVTFDVAHVWKGADATEIDVTTAASGPSCGARFEWNTSYIVYARRHDDSFTTSLCARNILSENAAWEVFFLADPDSAGSPPPTLDDAFALYHDPATQREAIAILSDLGPAHPRIAAFVRRELNSIHAHRTAAALRLVQGMDAAGAMFRPEVERLHTDWQTRKIRDEAINTTSGFRTSSRRPDPEVWSLAPDKLADRLSAMYASSTHRDHEQRMDLCRRSVEFLSHDDARVRTVAVYIVGGVACRGRGDVRPLLAEATEDPDRGVREAAGIILGMLNRRFEILADSSHTKE